MRNSTIFGFSMDVETLIKEKEFPNLAAALDGDIIPCINKLQVQDKDASQSSSLS